MVVETWTADKGYRPPYWALVSLAREAALGTPHR
jgi:hypothetical protein